MALFPPGKGGGQGVERGYKGKGVTIHNLVDAQGMPLHSTQTAANDDERQQVPILLDGVVVKTNKPGRPRKRPKTMAGDKGYDDKKIRAFLRKRGIKPEMVKRVWKNKKRRGRPTNMTTKRYVVERCFSWFQRKFRRLAIRWERKPLNFTAFILLGIIHIWMGRLI